MVSIRPAIKQDSALILRFIKALAEYEKLEDEVEVKVIDIERTLFNGQAKAFALIAEVEGEAAGFALYFYNYSTFIGKHGIYLEDLFVLPEYRQHKVGFSLLKSLANIAVENDCARIDWAVLDWNELAINFYHKIGAKAQTEWTGYRLSGRNLTDFAQM